MVNSDGRGSTRNHSNILLMRDITKKLENLYSWTQFYQRTGNKNQIRKCQTEIAQLKKAYNDLKTKKK
jgi:hypothetical protein